VRRLKRLLRNPVVMEIGCLLAAAYIRLVWLSGRWRVEDRAPADEMVAAGTPFIACFWHSRLLMLAFAWRYKPRLSIVISRHRDGRFIARAVRYIGIGTIAGSSSKGGVAAYRELLNILRSGNYVGITPDGPRGPRQRATLGAVRAAQMSGARLLPVSYGVSRRRMLNSWDRFIVPFPFARGIIRVGAPIEVPRDADDAAIERIRGQLEATLNELTWDIDTGFGFPRVEPADEPRRSARDEVATAAPEQLRVAGER